MSDPNADRDRHLVGMPDPNAKPPPEPTPKPADYLKALDDISSALQIEFAEPPFTAQSQRVLDRCAAVLAKVRAS